MFVVYNNKACMSTKLEAIKVGIDYIATTFAELIFMDFSKVTAITEES